MTGSQVGLKYRAITLPNDRAKGKLTLTAPQLPIAGGRSLGLPESKQGEGFGKCVQSFVPSHQHGQFNGDGARNTKPPPQLADNLVRIARDLARTTTRQMTCNGAQADEH